MFQIHRAGANGHISYGTSLTRLVHPKTCLTWTIGLWLLEKLCEAWLWSRVEMLYRKIADAPSRLKVSEVRPGAIVLWPLAYFYWVSAVLLLLALPWWFSKDCEILSKVTQRLIFLLWIKSQFFSSSAFLRITLAKTVLGQMFWTLTRTEVDKKTPIFSMLYEYPELITY